ncbi:hypothetical protein NKI89_03235 [Mesorhizobium sp. M0309]|uniref:hypothetical protein n=1 Tax=Mesorhizobium sp. M0309 TaxID=2956933 RepID=UPI00333D73F1
MNKPNDRPHFRDSPLITAERLNANWNEALKLLPEWAGIAHVLPDRLHVVVGGKHPLPMFLPPLEMAVLAETTRFGHGVVTNANGSGPNGRAYAKLSLRDAADRNPTVRRYLSGADEGTAVKPLEIVSDYSASNSYFVSDGHAKRAAREEVLLHVKALAQVHLAPRELDAYLANLNELLQVLDGGILDLPEAAE